MFGGGGGWGGVSLPVVRGHSDLSGWVVPNGVTDQHALSLYTL